MAVAIINERSYLWSIERVLVEKVLSRDVFNSSSRHVSTRPRMGRRPGGFRDACISICKFAIDFSNPTDSVTPGLPDGQRRGGTDGTAADYGPSC